MNADSRLAQLDFDTSSTSGNDAGRLFRLGCQCYRQKLRRRVEQAGTQLAPPAKQHVRVQPVLQRQLRYRHRLVASLLRQLPLELQRIVRAASALPLFCFTYQDSPHQKIVGTTLRLMLSSVYTVLGRRLRKLHVSLLRKSSGRTKSRHCMVWQHYGLARRSKKQKRQHARSRMAPYSGNS